MNNQKINSGKVKMLPDCSYLQIPDPYPFPYIGRAKWPQITEPSGQLDWINTISHVEKWLCDFVGPHWVDWLWTQELDQPSWICSVAFRKDRSRTLFLLKWGE